MPQISAFSLIVSKVSSIAFLVPKIPPPLSIHTDHKTFDMFVIDNVSDESVKVPCSDIVPRYAVSLVRLLDGYCYSVLASVRIFPSNE